MVLVNIINLQRFDPSPQSTSLELCVLLQINGQVQVV